MIPMWKINGRLGNQMFQRAFIYAWSKDLHVDSFMQDPAYFDKYADDIKKIYGEGLGFIDKVSIHVRRGDYVNNSFYVDLFEDGYYERAMRKFKRDEKFLVFSDDIQWCRSQEIFKNCEFVESGVDWEDLNVMASCKDNIIANSSFSWWAAYINKNPIKKIVAPMGWYNDGVERTKCPQDWIRV